MLRIQQTMLMASVAAAALWGQTSGKNTPLASIPIEIGNDYHLYVQARVNGSDAMRCSLDSGGGDRSYLDGQKAAALGIQSTAPGYSGGPQASSMTTDARARVNWELGGLKLPDIQLIMQNRPYADFACNIGLGVLRPFVVELDYDIPVVRVYDPAKYEASGRGKAVPFTLEQGTPFVNVAISFGKGDPVQARLAVDTGGGRPAAYLTKSFVDRYGILERVMKTVPDFWSGFSGGQPRVLAARMEKLSLGTVELTRPMVYLWQVRGFGGGNEPDGLLCPDFLRRFKIVFDYPRQKLVLEPGPHFGDEAPFDASGTMVYREGQNPYRVVRVIEGSAAAEAGLRAADIVLEVDGKPAAQLSNPDIAAIPRQSGREVTLLIQRGEERHLIKVKLQRLL